MNAPLAFLGAALLVTTASARAQDPRPFDHAPFDHATVEVLAARDTCHVHERLTLRIRAGVRDEFLHDHILQPFRVELDVPVRVEAGWWDGLQGTLVPDEVAQPRGGASAGPTFVLNDELAHGMEVEVPDRPGFTFVEVARSYFVERAGELVIPGPTLRASHATEFREDFLEGRVAADRREAVVQGDALTLKVLPLPEAGRPPEFEGAVGRFTIRAEAEPKELRVGQSLSLVVEVRGQGNLARIPAPRLEGLAGFHRYGVVEVRGPDYRRWTCELAPLHAAVSGVPAIPLAFFDPTPPPSYRTVRTDPIPLRVRPGAGGEADLPGTGEAPAAEEAIRDIHGPMPVAPERNATVRIPSGVLAVALLLPWLLAAGLWSRLRARARSPAGAEVAAREAALVFRRQASRTETDLANAFAAYLAARMRCRPAAVVAPQLPVRLRDAGIGEELAGRAAEVLGELLAARFGARSGWESSPDATERTVALVAELEGAFASAEGGT